MKIPEIPAVAYTEIHRREELTPGTVLAIAESSLKDFTFHVGRLLINDPEFTPCRVIFANQPSFTDRVPSFGPSPDLFQLINVGQYRKRFFGKLGDSVAVVLPNNASWMLKSYQSYVDPSPDKAINFIIATGMLTTGHSLPVGTVKNELFIGLDEKYHREVYGMVRPVKRRKTLTDIDTFVNNSAESYAGALRNGLRHIYPGGLPTLGKRG